MVDSKKTETKLPRVTLQFKSETLEQFIEHYAEDVSQGGIFLRTTEPLAVGTRVEVDLQLRNGKPLLGGEGTIVWKRETDPSKPAVAAGMGIRFDRLNDGSHSVLEKALAQKAKQASQRSSTEMDSTDQFAETPTRVAPAALQEALLGLRSGRHEPTPFRSDADQFGAETFENATKLRSIDDVMAEAAKADPKVATVVPPDPVADPRPEQTSNTKNFKPLVKTTLGVEPASPRVDRPPETKSFKLPVKTRLGVEPAAAPKPHVDRAARQRTKAPLVIGLMVVPVIGAAVSYFALRESGQERAKPSTGSAIGGSASSPTDDATENATANLWAKSPVVETVIESSVAGSIVSVLGTDQRGPAPLTAKLQKGRPYKVRIEADGFAKLQLDIIGGQEVVYGRPIAKPRFLVITSEPSGAAIFIDNAPTGFTPFDVEITEAQLGQPTFRVELRKGGFRPVDLIVQAADFVEQDPRMVLKVKAKLEAIAP